MCCKQNRKVPFINRVDCLNILKTSPLNSKTALLNRETPSLNGGTASWFRVWMQARWALDAEPCKFVSRGGGVCLFWGDGQEERKTSFSPCGRGESASLGHKNGVLKWNVHIGVL